MSIQDFNSFFGAVPTASTLYIQSPGTWSIPRYSVHIPNDEEFIKTCAFKWSFNAKPDIVIHTSHNMAICIEAKFESGESSYPTSSADKKEFIKRSLNRVKQTELQRHVMENLLGIKIEFLFLVQQKPTRTTYPTLSWSEAFGLLNLRGTPIFVRQWLQRIGVSVRYA